MPKNPNLNIARYKVGGGELNQFEFNQNQQAYVEQHQHEADNLIPGTPPEAKSEAEPGGALGELAADVVAKSEAKTTKKAATKKAATKKAATKKSAKARPRSTKKAATKKRSVSQKGREKKSSKKTKPAKRSSASKRGPAKKAAKRSTKKAAKKSGTKKK